MAYGKIEPLIDTARKQAIEQSNTDLRAFIDGIDAQLYILELQIDEKIEQIQARLRKLEEGVSPSLNDCG